MEIEARHRQTVTEAIRAFHEAKPGLADGTKRSYERTLRFLEDFAAARNVATIDRADLAFLEAFRAGRSVTAATWTKELGTLRHFFRYCGKHGWILENPAKDLPTPRNVKGSDREPYSPNDVARILAACETIGRGPYERLRARAMVLVLRYTALRISDVATLRKDRIRAGRVYLRTTKNGKPVFLPVHQDLQAALDTLPLPRGADGPDCPYYFWSGHGARESMIRDATRTLAAAFRTSGVAGACAHRFRHTLATEVLERGGSIEDAADILGDTETIIRKHYAKWTAGRQARIDELLSRVWHVSGTRKSGDEQTVWN